MNEREKKMRQAGLKIGLLMGVTLSFFLSLTGSLTSGHFNLAGWILSFLMSTVISLVISFLVPMKKVHNAIEKKFDLAPDSVSARCIESLVSDLIYTPFITFCMVFLSYKMATARGAQLHLLPMFLSSLMVCFIIGFILIFVFVPFFSKLILKHQ